MPSEPVRPASVTVKAAVGMLRCRCGLELPRQDLTEPVRCPRCSQVWMVRAVITQVPEPRKRGVDSAPAV